MSLSTKQCGVFPHFTNGDVKIILSEKSEDTFTLHTKVLAKSSPFFEASLGRAEWSHNKSVDPEHAGQSLKLLVLDLEDSDTFPLLMGTQIESESHALEEKRKQYDTPLPGYHKEYFQPTFARYSSSIVIAAYKLGFAIMYGLRPSADDLDLERLGKIIPAVADFADACGLLPGFASQINTLIFGHAWNGFEVIALNPFPMLLAAVKLESKVIYEEAMKHAVAVDRRHGGNPSILRCNPNYFTDHEEPTLQAMLAQHARDFSAATEQVLKDLLNIEPIMCNKIGVAKNIGVGIFRDWVVKEVLNDSSGCGVLTLLNREYNVSGIMSDWSAKDWQQQVGVRFGHVHRATESCFKQASWAAAKSFDPEDMAKGDPVARTSSPHLPLARYLACLRFGADDTDYQYPWSSTAKTEEYVMDKLRAKEDEEMPRRENQW
ncbi:hypothetical protein LTR56_000212 [Elasticomyces elasticus]|nr:hypothetical protein LTR56_000212 [Elasticomyces elasticus]KAK3667200.1 hypothetical protein LTR22_002065 [Elasticomyces elasticus]KAK4932974.1 hypothetical protein LTR49_000931 [Elasticomyces elasticus]KAK5768619.1 hypothetical protein LTS12_001044 [Elasticomyces elasticus]